MLADLSDTGRNSKNKCMRNAVLLSTFLLLLLFLCKARLGKTSGTSNSSKAIRVTRGMMVREVCFPTLPAMLECRFSLAGA